MKNNLEFAIAYHFTQGLKMYGPDVSNYIGEYYSRMWWSSIRATLEEILPVMSSRLNRPSVELLKRLNPIDAFIPRPAEVLTEPEIVDLSEEPAVPKSRKRKRQMAELDEMDNVIVVL